MVDHYYTKVKMPSLEFGEPARKPKGFYTQKAKKYSEEFLQAIKIGKCTTNMAKIVNPRAKTDQKQFYNAFKSLRRRGKIENIDVAIIEGDLWLIYEGST